MAKQYLIGTSGWNYRHWKGNFYPEDIKKKDWFSYFAKTFDTVEVNYSFYNWPKKEVLERWKDNSPNGFKYTMKAPRLITHLKKLKGVEKLVRDFYDLTSALGNKCGCHLFQLPPSFVYNENNVDKLKKFLDSLDGRKDNAIEFRHSSWWCDEIYRLLKKYNVGFVMVDGLGMPNDTVITGDIAYLRLHGENYGGNYSKKVLKEYADTLKKKKCKKVYVYFNNDDQGYAPKNALELRSLLS